MLVLLWLPAMTLFIHSGNPAQGIGPTHFQVGFPSSVSSLETLTQTVWKSVSSVILNQDEDKV